jgi:hypothetical protein
MPRPSRLSESRLWKIPTDREVSALRPPKRLLHKQSPTRLAETALSGQELGHRQPQAHEGLDFRGGRSAKYRFWTRSGDSKDSF